MERLAGRLVMIYTLKHFDTPLISFSADSGAEMNIEITFVDEKKRVLFPLDLQEVTPSGIQSWLKHRTVPKNRAYVDSILSSMGLSINRPLDATPPRMLARPFSRFLRG